MQNFIPNNGSVGSISQLNSWDKFLVTLPFSKCYFFWSDPIYVDQKIDNKTILIMEKKLENELNNNLEKAKNMAK